MRHWRPLVALAVAATLLTWGGGIAHGEVTKPFVTASGQTVTVPAEVPDRADLTLLGAGLMDEAVIVLLYDDPRTDRPVDYAEAYDLTGYLVAIRWIDEQGIERRAHDRSLTEPDATGPSGVFVLSSPDADAI